MKKITFFLLTFALLVGGALTALSAPMITTKLFYDGALRNYSAEEVKVSINGEILTQYSMFPIILNDRALVPARDVFEKMGCQVEWNDPKRQVTVKNDDNTVLIYIDKTTATRNGKEFKMDVPAKIVNDRTMIPLRAVSEAVGCQVSWNDKTRIASITYTPSTTTTTITTTTTTTTEATTVTTTAITTTTEKITEATTAYQSATNVKSGGIKIIWDQITNVNANNIDGKRETINGLDVISPTWFSIKNSEGDLNDVGSLEYAQWAKSNGYQIWGLVTNSFNTTITHDVLSDPNKRLKVINQLVAVADKYDLDGINVDFENVGSADGDYYLAFIKELTPVLKAKGLVVSVDTFIIKPWNSQYKVKEVGEIVDYVIVMTYDEHWSTCQTAGSVASKNWVDTAMQDMIKAVDKDKLIMGMPFYTRLWAETTTADGVKVTSTAYSMENGYKNLVENNANIVWNEEAGQYYGEYIKDGVKYKMWLEDERSIEEKLKISRKYDVKGVACWKRGFEKATVWNVINNYYS